MGKALSHARAGHEHIIGTWPQTCFLLLTLAQACICVPYVFFSPICRAPPGPKGRASAGPKGGPPPTPKGGAPPTPKGGAPPVPKGGSL